MVLEWDKNASQTGRNDVIGGFDGKEVRIGMQPCSVQMQVAGGEA